MSNAIRRRRVLGGASEIDYSKEYLTVEMLEDARVGQISLSIRCPSGISLKRKVIDNTGEVLLDWTTISVSNSFSIGRGWKVQLAGDNSRSLSTATKNTAVTMNNSVAITIGSASIAGGLRVYGNVMSLYSSDPNVFPTKVVSYARTFPCLFYQNTGIEDASNLVLPNFLNEGQYINTFYGCTALENAPSLNNINVSTNLPLPAKQYCYAWMFYGCSALGKAPELPITSLAQYCYYYMFARCSSLERSPVLPALSLATRCYSCMFTQCSKLNYVKAMFTTNITSSTNYTTSWLGGVASSGTYVKNANATYTLRGANGIPSSWTIETATP